MWNESLQKWIDDDELAVIGIVQEQHAERTRLYKQWRQFSWPIVQDALNLTNVKVVPLAIAVDEQGFVVSHNATPKFISGWLTEDEPTDRSTTDWSPTIEQDLAPVREKFLWGGVDGINLAITDYESLLADSHAKNQATHFELAVCYRNRFESEGNPEDFQKAVDHWSRALQIDPNQYIYRRRIQQYGARLGKPYPFYDWVEKAIHEIRERGDQPVELTVEISGAEIASPVRKFETGKADRDWDDALRIDPDKQGLVNVHLVAVPGVVRPGSAARVHVLVSPGENAKWNNAGEPMTFLVRSAEGASFSTRQLDFELPAEEESTEIRRFEFEVRLDPSADGPVTVEGMALFGICIVDSGQCTWLRKPFRIEIEPDLTTPK